MFNIYNKIIMKEKDTDLLKRMKYHAFLLKWFGKEIPSEYHLPLICSNIDDSKLLKKFLKKHKLITRGRIQTFIAHYWDKHYFKELLAVALDSSFDIVDWVLEVLKRDADFCIPFTGNCNYENKFFITQGSVSHILEIEDMKVLQRFFEYMGTPTNYQLIAERAIETQNLDVLKIICEEELITGYTIEKAFESKHKSVIEVIFKYAHDIPVWAVDSLIQRKEYSDIAKDYVAHNTLNAFTISKLIKEGNKKLLACHIKNFPLSEDLLCELAEAGMLDLIKLHYNKYGVSRNVVNYIANLEIFKKKIGV